MQQNNEDARRISHWLHQWLTEAGYEVLAINWVQNGLQAKVFVFDRCIGTLGECYQEFRDGVLIERLHQELP